MAITTGSLYSVIGLDCAWSFALIAALMNLIPQVGSILATVLPLPLVLLDGDLEQYQQILCLVLPILFQQITGNVLEPYLFGKTLEIHPISILLSLAFWLNIWGIPGMILSVCGKARSKLRLPRLTSTLLSFQVPLMAILRLVLHANENSPVAVLFVQLLEGNVSGAPKAFERTAAEDIRRGTLFSKPMANVDEGNEGDED